MLDDTLPIIEDLLLIQRTKFSSNLAIMLNALPVRNYYEVKSIVAERYC
jgi:hypothetical protein